MLKNVSVKTLKPIIFLGLVLILSAFNTSCALRMFEPPPEPTVLKNKQLPSKVAILPFVNNTSTPEAGVLVRRMFYNFFSSLNYRDLEPFEVDQNLKLNDLYADVTAGRTVSPRQLGQLLGVDAVHKVVHEASPGAVIRNDSVIEVKTPVKKTILKAGKITGNPSFCIGRSK